MRFAWQSGLEFSANAQDLPGNGYLRKQSEMRRSSVVVTFVLFFFFCPLRAQKDYLDTWPSGDDPIQVGKQLAEHFVTSPHQYATATLHYSEVVAYYGALRFAQATRDDALSQALAHKFEPLMPGNAEDARIPNRQHVDDEVFGVVPLELGIDTHASRFLDYGLTFADRQWKNPLPNGLTPESRFWIDDMYMVTILQVEAYRATNKSEYIDRAAAEMVAYLKKLQQPNGLFFHADDVPIVWSRGDGWVASGMTELLISLPENHPMRAEILNAYRKMMSALLQFQGKDGMWRQIVDDDEAWPETSGSAMFAFAMISGVKHGWLDAERYGPAARKAWIALVGYIDQNEDVTSVCEGTNKKNDVDYYLSRHRRTGDFHGQAPMMWAATALLPSRPEVKQDVH